tara:strand:+ start:25616 stop:27100 length:1485 start_codon:yes stop_codon:yes gene_type:complete
MIRRYYATKDNTITNAFEENLVNRGTGSNMGASDILEVFSIYGQASSSLGLSSELARTLIEFNVTEISSSRDSGTIPAAGSVSFYLNMYNAPHSQTIPSNFTMQVLAVSSSWEEGYGLDMELYEDKTNDKIGSNWIQARQSASHADDGKWNKVGGDYHASPTFSQNFSSGLENLSLDVTSLVEQWIAGTKQNYGFGIKLSNTFETYFSSSTGANTGSIIHNTSGQRRSFFTKKFFGRDTEFYHQRPVLEARWDSSRKDDRGYFHASSSLVSANENLNNIYLYNRVRGRLRNYPIAPTSASIRISSTATTGSNMVSASVSNVATGVYKARLALDTTASTVYDIWYSGSIGYHTGTIDVKSFQSLGYNPEDVYVLSMPSLRKEYRKNQTHRLNLYVREKNWSPNIHTIAVRSSIPSAIIPSASFQLKRCIDDHIVVPYGTGSTLHTSLSYDVSGNYFDLDTTYLESGYLYDIQYSFYDEENGWEEQPYRFKFRVVD